MEIYLIRHTTPAVDKGVCYGQSDLDVTESFAAEAAAIRPHLPEGIRQVHSSPLQRCSKLAQHLFPQHGHLYHNDLKEIHCGEWELQRWDDIPKEAIAPWMDDFVNVAIPGGESYVTVFERVVAKFEQIAQGPVPAAVVAHGGVIRSILAHITGTALADSFDVFKLYYGCVAKLYRKAGEWRYEMLHNVPPPEAETHQPSYY
jgi:alpha-ribazole phosphatase